MSADLKEQCHRAVKNFWSDNDANSFDDRAPQVPKEVGQGFGPD
jgi:hypothetical protein